ncbi:MAG: hypothetical protein VKK80_12005 [Prochlorothrix sp.]|nr:hypothetical protein [Prochlorothrix sp.]
MSHPAPLQHHTFAATDLPQSIVSILNQVSEYRYGELYEEGGDQSLSLKTAINYVFDALESSRPQTYPQLSQARYIWMALLLSIAVWPGLEFYQPQNPCPQETVNRLELWLYLWRSLKRSQDWDELDTLLGQEPDISPWENWPKYPVKDSCPSLQLVTDCIWAYENAQRTLIRAEARSACFDLVESCLEDYAIMAGSAQRRDLFDWWLWAVIPATLTFSKPKWWFEPQHNAKAVFLSFSPSLEQSLKALKALIYFESAEVYNPPHPPQSQSLNKSNRSTLILHKPQISTSFTRRPDWTRQRPA